MAATYLGASPRLGVAALVVGLVSSLPGACGSCFLPLPTPTEPLAKAPFDNASIAEMRRRFIANFDFNTGTIVASPAAVPAQSSLGGDGATGYKYEWVRDGALSIRALMKLADSPIGQVGEADHLTPKMVDIIVPKYVARVTKALGAKTGGIRAEPRFTLGKGSTIADTWCRPQTDGPGLRAMALIEYAMRPNSPDEAKEKAWALAHQDLDWLSEPQNVHRPSCDLWEESMDDGDLLWNHIVSQRALSDGHRLAGSLGEWEKAQQYHGALTQSLNKVLASHVKNASVGAYVSECSAQGMKCMARGGDIDGAVILSFIHGDWSEGSPTSHPVANTVRLLNEKFCEMYEINRKDTNQGLPGILYGRYEKDEYGGGNPWVLITAALASLFYQAAISAAHSGRLPEKVLKAWQLALYPVFQGSAGEFAAAGDAVLTRLVAHVAANDYQLYEQIHKVTGHQYNAADLTWSYAEVLSALRLRDEALNVIDGKFVV